MVIGSQSSDVRACETKPVPSSRFEPSSTGTRAIGGRPPHPAPSAHSGSREPSAAPRGITRGSSTPSRVGAHVEFSHPSGYGLPAATVSAESAARARAGLPCRQAITAAARSFATAGSGGGEVPPASGAAAQPALCAYQSKVACATESDLEAHGTKAPLCMMAAWKRPLDWGETMCTETDAAPADSPKIVTRPGSPPNAATLSRTQRSAACWSFTCTLPVLLSGLRARSCQPPSAPKGPSL